MSLTACFALSMLHNSTTSIRPSNGPIVCSAHSANLRFVLRASKTLRWQPLVVSEGIFCTEPFRNRGLRAQRGDDYVAGFGMQQLRQQHWITAAVSNVNWRAKHIICVAWVFFAKTCGCLFAGFISHRRWVTRSSGLV